MFAAANEIDEERVNLCYNANVAFAKRLPAGRNKMALGAHL